MSVFDRGETPKIAVFNQAATPLGLNLVELVTALQSYVDEQLVPIWACPATLSVTAGPVAGSWSMVFMDDADAPGALAYHDLDSGLPIAKVFVKTTLAAKESLSVSASHELAEMLVDPGINEWAQAEDGSFVSYEACDPVEETSFMVNGFAMSDFVTPAYFQSWRAPGSVPFSYCNAVDRPFALEKGGYQITWRGGRQGERDALELVHGSGAKAARFALEDRRGHRSEYRRQLLGT